MVGGKKWYFVDNSREVAHYQYRAEIAMRKMLGIEGQRRSQILLAEFIHIDSNITGDKFDKVLMLSDLPWISQYLPRMGLATFARANISAVDRENDIVIIKPVVLNMTK